MAAVYDLLYQLGVTANYTCFFHTACAVSLCVEPGSAAAGDKVAVPGGGEAV